ncbi:VapE family protein [Arcanobacterium hippocoleae]
MRVFGTTNAESGYLRDTTGNRRFWPVVTPGNGVKASWDLTGAQIDQIWAETLVYVNRGEPLYLEASLLAQAVVQQHQAMETDEREGLIQAYLDTLLPEDWEEMDLYARRNYLDGASEFGTVSQAGNVVRKVVSNLEIWCECLGKNRADLTAMDSTRIRQVLIKLGWNRHQSKKRLALYGPQWVYTRQVDPAAVFHHNQSIPGTTDPDTGSHPYRSTATDLGMAVPEPVEIPI